MAICLGFWPVFAEIKIHKKTNGNDLNKIGGSTLVLIPREIPIFLNQRFCEMSLSMFQLTAFSFCELYVINRYVSFVTRSSGSSKLYLKQNYIAKCFGTKFNLNRSRGPCNWFVCKISDLWKEIYQDITPFFAQKIWHLDFEYHNLLSSPHKTLPPNMARLTGRFLRI